MKDIRWSDEKDALLRADPNRGGIGLVECAEAIRKGNVLGLVQNPSVNHSDQRMYVQNVDGYAYCVPFVEDDTQIFLKTVYPSRRFTTLFLRQLQ